MKRTILAERNVKEAAFKLLYADELQNALLLKCIVQNRAADIRVLGQSVSLRDKSSGHYFFRSEEIGEFEALYGTAEPKVFFISTDVLYEDLRRLHPQLDIHKYAQMVYKGDGNFDLKEYDGIAFRKMTPEDLPFVVATQDGRVHRRVIQFFRQFKHCRHLPFLFALFLHERVAFPLP